MLRVPVLSLLLTASLAACSMPPDPDNPVTQEEVSRAHAMILDQGYRCQSVAGIARLNNEGGWNVRCVAPDAGGVLRDHWSYGVIKRTQLWQVTARKAGSRV